MIPLKTTVAYDAADPQDVAEGPGPATHAIRCVHVDPGVGERS